MGSGGGRIHGRNRILSWLPATAFAPCPLRADVGAAVAGAAALQCSCGRPLPIFMSSGVAKLRLRLPMSFRCYYEEVFRQRRCLLLVMSSQAGGWRAEGKE